MKSLSDITKDAVSAFAAGGGVGASGILTITLPGFRGAFEHTETVAVAGVSASDRIMLALAPHLDTDENGHDMLDVKTLAANAGTDTIEVVATFSELTSGPIKLIYKVI